MLFSLVSADRRSLPANRVSIVEARESQPRQHEVARIDTHLSVALEEPASDWAGL